MTGLPETILQFGSGRFLRAFADLFIHHANAQGQDVGRVVIVQSTETIAPERSAGLAANTMFWSGASRTGRWSTGSSLANLSAGP